MKWLKSSTAPLIWAPSSEFVSSSIPSWQILTAHAQPFRGARDLAFCLKVPLDSLLIWASSEGSGETARMRRLAWTFAARIGDKYQIRLTRSISYSEIELREHFCQIDSLDITYAIEIVALGQQKSLYCRSSCKACNQAGLWSKSALMPPTHPRR